MDFTISWLVIAAALLGLGAVGIWFWKKRATPMFLCLAGGLFMLAGSGPIVGKAGETKHLVLIDASDSMAADFMNAQAVVLKVLKDKKDENSSIEVRYFNDRLIDSQNISPAGQTLPQVIPTKEDLGINGDIVVVSDGHFLNGLLPHAGTILCKTPSPTQPDVSILNISAPTILPEGSTVLVSAGIRCDSDSTVRWVLSGRHGQVDSGELVVQAGLATDLSASFTAKGSGVQRFRLTLSLSGDREPRNNVAEFALTVAGVRQVYYAVEEGISADNDGLAQALKAMPDTHVVRYAQLPASRSDLDSYHLLVINNISAITASTRQLSEIADWVRSGGALFMAGTDKAFGPGGYRGTAIEDILPVKLMPADEPGRTVLLAVDTSSSMAEGNKLTVLRRVANHLLDSLSMQDRAAIAGFSSGFRADIRYSSPSSQRATIGRLSASGSTDIGAALAQSITSLTDVQPTQEPKKRLLLVTDGKDESESPADFEGLANKCTTENIRLDVILTASDAPDWAKAMRIAAPTNVFVWQASSDNFESLLETLDRALQGYDQRLVSTVKMEIPGVQAPLNRFVRTSARNASSGDVSILLQAQTPITGKPIYPFLAFRHVAGMTAVLTADTWGGVSTTKVWEDSYFKDQLQLLLNEVLAGASSPLLELRQVAGQWKLLWIGVGEPPNSELLIKGQMRATPAQEGVWSLPKAPQGDEILVYQKTNLLQCIPLTAAINQELAYTGINEPWFGAAESSGYTVINNLQNWEPSKAIDGGRMNVTWIPALLAMIALLTGFALRHDSD